MAHRDVYDMLTALIVSNWTATSVLLPNDATQTPPDGSAWIKPEFVTVRNSKAALTHDRREEGALRIAVAVPVLSGVETLHGYCADLAVLLSTYREGGLLTGEPSINEGRDDGGYFVASVIVPYRFEYQR